MARAIFSASAAGDGGVHENAVREQFRGDVASEGLPTPRTGAVRLGLD
jgi:hypothetical protein